MPSIYGTNEHDVDAYVLYKPQTWVTGSNLGSYLGVEYGSDMPDRRVEYLVRWGNSDRIGYIPSEQTINLRTAVEANTDKFNSLQRIEESGARVPPHSRDPEDLRLPIYGRSEQHQGGSDIEVYERWDDVDHTRDFYTERVPIDTEYRVHVINGQVRKVAEKEQREDPEDGATGLPHFIRNYEHGYRFVYPDTEPPGLWQAVPAVEALDLDIGAVDLVITRDGTPYVLEVNTAPSLDAPTMEVYGGALADMIGISDVPGIAATDLDGSEGGDDGADGDGSAEQSDESASTDAVDSSRLSLLRD
jgi:hypothetical protein